MTPAGMAAPTTAQKPPTDHHPSLETAKSEPTVPRARAA
jgi:hypothetical protein